VATASDTQVVNEIALCMATYMRDLLFKRDKYGRYIGSPYDNFLRVNHLPRNRWLGKPKAAYNLRLYQQVVALKNPIYITQAMHVCLPYQPYQFGALGCRVRFFFRPRRGRGECACRQLRRMPPGSGLFRLCLPQQRRLQEEYDAANGQGAFAKL